MPGGPKIEKQDKCVASRGAKIVTDGGAEHTAALQTVTPSPCTLGCFWVQNETLHEYGTQFLKLKS